MPKKDTGFGWVYCQPKQPPPRSCRWCGDDFVLTPQGIVCCRTCDAVIVWPVVRCDHPSGE